MKIEKLTDDHRLLTAQVKEDWLSRYCSGEPINKDLAREGIEWLYTFSGKRKAPRIIFVDSPLMAQKVANYIEVLLNKLKARKGLADEVGDEVWAEVRAEVGDEVWAEVRAEVRAEVGAEVWAEVGAEVWAEVGAQKLKKYYKFAWYGSLADYGWVSFYDFFDQIGLLDGRPEARDKFRTFRDKVLRANVYDMIQLNRFCIVVALPKYVKRDQAKRVHSLKGHAIEFKDGYGINRIHGVKFDKTLFSRFTKGEVTALEIITHKNQDQKRAMAMAYGNEKLVNELKAQVVSEEVDKLGNTMRILVVKDSEEDLVFYEAIDPSKDEKVYLRIPPEFAIKTAREAKVWTFPVMWEEYEKTGKLPEFAIET